VKRDVTVAFLLGNWKITLIRSKVVLGRLLLRDCNYRHQGPQAEGIEI